MPNTRPVGERRYDLGGLLRQFQNVREGETVHVRPGVYVRGDAMWINSSFSGSWEYIPAKRTHKRPVSAIFYPMVHECGY